MKDAAKASEEQISQLKAQIAASSSDDKDEQDVQVTVGLLLNAQT